MGENYERIYNLCFNCIRPFNSFSISCAYPTMDREVVMDIFNIFKRFQSHDSILNEIENLKNDYEMKLRDKELQIRSLEKVIDDKNRFIKDAKRDNQETKELTIKVKEIIAICDYMYKLHTENNTRIMTGFSDARNELEDCVKKLLR